MTEEVGVGERQHSVAICASSGANRAGSSRGRQDQVVDYAALPTKRMGAGALIRDGDDRVLLVKPTYKWGWEIPGGIVERNESPHACCGRELAEELGVAIEPGRLLVVDWLSALHDRTEGVMLIFDGGRVDDSLATRMTPAAGELSDLCFVDVESLGGLVSARKARRLRAAWACVRDGTATYLDDGALPL